MEFMTPLPDDPDIPTARSWSHLTERYRSYDETKAGRKRPQHSSLLSYLGGRQLAETMKPLFCARKNKIKDVNFFLQKVAELCLPRFILLYEHYKFFTLSQKSDQCICEFLLNLVGQFQHCWLPEFTEANFKERIIEGVADRDRDLADMLKNAQGDLKDILKVCEEKGVCNDHMICRVNFLRVQQEIVSASNSKNSLVLPDSSSSERACFSSEDFGLSARNRHSAVKLKSSSHHRLRGSSCRSENNAVASEKRKDVENSLSTNLYGKLPVSSLGHNNRPTLFECLSCGCFFAKKKQLTSHMTSCPGNQTVSTQSDQTFALVNVEEKIHSEYKHEIHDQDNLCPTDIEPPGKVTGAEFDTDSSGSKPPPKSKTVKSVRKSDIAVKSSRQMIYPKSPTQKWAVEKKYRYNNECTICGKKFRWPCILKQHFSLKHPEESLPKDMGGVCSYCGKVFQSSITLHKHESMHARQRFPCELCGAILNSKKMYDCHKDRRHSQMPLPKPFVCEVCGKAFRFQSSFLGHISKHSSEKPFQCDKCDLKFKKKKSFLQHLEIHNGNAPFKCEACGECFINKKPYMNHIRKHSGEKPYICSTCAARFRTQSALCGHVKIHDANRPRSHVCTVCGYSCVKRGNLTKHTLKHTGVKPHSCPVCNAGFTTTYGKYKHMRRIHGMQNPRVILPSGPNSLVTTSTSPAPPVSVIAPSLYPSTMPTFGSVV